uniref:SID1 transmembrane family member 1 n=1 Tax=Caenorhabditis japonica TaxID=281687 RepID=A0A8R1HYM8_CAEJA
MRLALFICLCFIKFVETQLPDVIPVKWDTDYTRKSERNSTLTIFQFVVPRKNSVGRVIMSSDDSSESNPLLVVFREKREILSLQIPLIADNYVYSKVSRTLCPFTNYEKGETFTVEVTSSQRVEYRFRAELVHNFWLTNNSKHEVTASASEPVFLRYDIPVNVDSVAVHVQSDSDTCMTVSIQKIECPVFDLPDNVNSIGMHQTMTKSTTIPVEREKLPSFYVVFVVNNNDDLCTEIASIKPKRPTKFPLRQKTFNVTIESSMKQSDYAIPIIFWAAILLIITIIVLLYHHLDGKWEQRFIAHVYERLEADAENARLSDFYDIKRMSEDDDLKDYDILTDCKDMMVVRAKSRLTVADLSMREHEVREKQYDAYKHVLVVLFIFYNITVVQLLINQASSSRQSGDLDLCTFNFQCARPLWNFVAFNNVYGALQTRSIRIVEDSATLATRECRKLRKRGRCFALISLNLTPNACEIHCSSGASLQRFIPSR